MDSKFTHILFTAEDTDMKASQFLSRVSSLSSNSITIVCSHAIVLDPLYDLLVQGASGYLVDPFVPERIDQAIAVASKGDPFPQQLLRSDDRTKALVGGVLKTFSLLVKAKKDADKHQSAKKQLPQLMAALEHSVDLAINFSEGGVFGYLEMLEDLLLNRGKAPASRIGLRRIQLAELRKKNKESGE